MPVAIVSNSDVSQVPQGQLNAPKVDMPKPLADKVGPTKPAQQDAPKVADKPEITTDAAAPATPPAKSDPKPADQHPKKTTEFKPDQIAELLGRDDPKKTPKPPDKPTPQKPTHEPPKFDASQVATLLDRRDPRRRTAAAEAINTTPDPGAASGQDAQLSQDEVEAFRKRVSGCWNLPAGVDVNSNIYVDLRIFLKPDGSLAQEPVLVAGPASALGPALAASARRALLLCQPFTMFKPEHYDQWKDIQIRFNPHELLGG